MAGGIFEAFQRGVDVSRNRRESDEERAFRQQEREYIAGRRAKLDPLNDQLLEHQVRESEFQAETRPLRREGMELGLEGTRLGVQKGRFDVERMPVVAAQQDEMHKLGIQQTQQQMALARNADQRAGAAAARAEQLHAGQVEAEDLRRRAAALQLNLAEVEAERKKLAQQWSRERQTLYRAGVRGDHAGVLAQLNELYGAVDDGNPDSGIRFDPESGRYYVADEAGEPVQDLGDIRGVIDFADLYVSDPEIFAASFVGQRQAAAEAARKQAEEDGKNFRAAVGAASNVVQAGALLERDPSELAGQVGDVARQISSGGRGAEPGATDVSAVPAEHARILLSEPTPERQAMFDEVYGPGAAREVIRQAQARSSQ